MNFFRISCSSFLFLFLFYGFAMGADTTDINQNTVKITILYTNNTNGSLDPCGCKGNKAGGMAQRMTILKEERAKDPELLLLDAGDFFQSIINPYHPDPVIQIMNLMKYDFATLGDQEFINGMSFLKQKIPAMQFVLVSANLGFTDSDAMLVPNDYVIKEIKGIKIGIIGIASESAFGGLSKETRENLKISDPLDITRKLMKKLHKEVNIIIILSHQGYSTDRNYASTLYWIDVIIGSHDGLLLDKVDNKVNDISIVQASKNGDHVGKIIIEYDTTAKKSKKIVGSSIFVDKKMPKDPEIEKIIKDYEKNVPLYSDTMGNIKFMGANFCKNCHLNEFNSWSKSPHFNALITLKKKEKMVMHSTQCYQCHTTNINSRDVFGVECESCHFMTKGHESTKINTKIEAKTCLKCHVKDKSPDFDFEIYKQKVKHQSDSSLSKIYSTTNSK